MKRLEKFALVGVMLGIVFWTNDVSWGAVFFGFFAGLFVALKS